MQSCARTVIPPEKRQPSVFRALCLPNTDFMVDFLGFFTRDDFEKFLQLTCKKMNQLILTHFHSKPYRYLDNVTLSFHLDDARGMTMSLDKRLSTTGWDPYSRRWVHLWTNQVGFSRMCPFLDMSVCVPKVNILITDDDILTQENIDKLKSLSHVWGNAEIELTSARYSNLVSRAKLLNEAKFFHCRRFKCSNMDVMLPLWDYPEIYSLETINFDISSLATYYDEYDPTPIIKLVENRALYPHSQTTFVLTGNRYSRHVQFFTNHVLQHICNKFIESDKAQSFRIIFALRTRFELPDGGDMDEFCLENNRSKELLHLRRVTYNDVSKNCEFDPEIKYFVLERYHV